MCTLDTIDFAILDELASNARTSLKELAELIKLSAPACSARIKRLEREEAIVGYHAVLDYEKLGYEITALVHIAVPPEKREAFRVFVRTQERIVSFDHITGAYSVLIRALFRNRRELGQFMTEVERFGKAQAQVVLSSMQKHLSYASSLEESV